MQHPDEGTIHAWLDAALPDEEAHVVEEHVAWCAECAARVAEARGLVAGASRILGALDDVPAGVVPTSGRAPRSAPRSAWWRRPAVGMAAAMTIVAVGTTMVVTRDWQRAVPPTAESTETLLLGSPDSAMRAMAETQVTGAPAEPEAVADAAESQAAPPASRPPLFASPRAADSMGARQGTDPRIAQTVEEAATTRARTLATRRVQETDRDQPTDAAKARQRVAGGAAASAPPLPVIRDSIATVEMPRLGDVRARSRPDTTVARQRLELREAAPQIVAGHTLMVTATSLAGCYALELRQAPDEMSPELPSVVQLAVSARDAANAIVAPPPAQGFNRNVLPLVVPPAMDSAQLGWRVAAADSVAVRLASDGRAVLVTFPAEISEPRMGFATAAELPGVPSWTGPVLVQRVPCP